MDGNMKNFNNTSSKKLDITLSEDQSKALEEILDWYKGVGFKTWSLKGAAGTGKTTLVSEIINQFNNLNYLCVAPTHKAKNVLAQKTGVNASTLHGFLGYKPYINLESVKDFSGFSKKKYTDAVDVDILILDEASMVSTVLKQQVEEVARRDEVSVLYIGDECQLPPIHEDTCPCLNIEGSTLSRVIRQSDSNPLLVLLTALRSDILSLTYGYTSIDAMNDLWELISRVFGDIFKFEDFDDLKIAVRESRSFTFLVKRVPEFFSNDQGYQFVTDASIVKELVANKRDMKILGYTNPNVSRYNKSYRNCHSHKNVYNIGEILMAYTNIATEEGLVMLYNGLDYRIEEIKNTTFDNKRVYRMYLKSVDYGTGFYFDVLDMRDFEKHARDYVDLMHKCKKTGNWKPIAQFRNSILLPEDLKDYFSETPDFCFNVSGSQICHLDQFPKAGLKYGYAMTTHKSQGSTYDDVLVTYNDMLVPTNFNDKQGKIMYLKLMYVALSRAAKCAYIYKESSK